MKKILALLLVLTTLFCAVSAAGESEKKPFRYVHDPRQNPNAMQDIIENPEAVYGFSPNPESTRLGNYADYDWTDPAFVAEAKKNREEYHASMESIMDIVYKMRDEGATMEEIARAASAERNRVRLAAHENNPDELATVKESNLNTYGNENGPTPEQLYEKYGSWQIVLQKAFSPNLGMDVICGLYDEYYDLYVELGLAEAAADSEQLTVEELKAKISAFEQNHSELKDLFPVLIGELQAIHQAGMRMAFTRIQARFEEMLEADRIKSGAPEDSLEPMREKLNIQASVLNAGFVAHMKKSFSMMAAVLRGGEYTDDGKSVIDLLKEMSAELAASDDEAALSSKANLDWIIETAENDYHGDLAAWYSELSARPELPPDAGDQPKDDSRPEPPPQGEKPADEGEPKEDRGKPFMDHFTVIQEELQAASQQIDAGIAEMFQSVSEQYGISEETAKEISEILRALAGLINADIMKQLQINETAMVDSLIR